MAVRHGFVVFPSPGSFTLRSRTPSTPTTPLEMIYKVQWFAEPHLLWVNNVARIQGRAGDSTPLDAFTEADWSSSIGEERVIFCVCGPTFLFAG